jgi:predicted nucleic acid-binding protein
MKYVLDSNVALKWVLPEPDADKAIRVRDDYRRGITELLSPDIFPVEIAHALVRAERRGITQPTEGWPKLVDVLNTPSVLHPYLPLLPRALAIASSARIGVYDCLYVALDEREGCHVLTADDRLVRSLPSGPIVLLSSRP